MRKLFGTLVLVLAIMCIFTACELLPNIPNGKEDAITIEGGYLVVNGVKTDYQVKTDDVIEVIDGYVAVNGVKTQYQVKTDDVIDVIDGYVYVNGVKTEHKVHTEPVVEVIDGYVAVNGVKTEFKVETTDVITIEDGYVVVNGVKTQYSVLAFGCNHIWDTVTVSPTCTKNGYDLMTCKLCDKNVIANETVKLDHAYSTTYSFDDNNHWFKCTGCDTKKGTAAHIPNADNNCTICGIPLSITPGVVYDISADGTYAEVIGYTGTESKVKIASEYQGLPVKNIYNEAFKSNRTITSVIIPNSVINIGDYAFYCCSNLSSLVIPDSIINIGDRAFQHCAGLSHVVIPDSVITIGKYAFASGYEPSVKSSLQSVVIGNGVTSIGEGAFDYCDSLISVVIGDSVTNIGDHAFSNCRSLTSIVIPDSVISIGNDAFAGCYNLCSIENLDSVVNIGNNVFGGCNSSLYSEYEYGKYVGSKDNPYAVLIEITNKNMSTYSIHEDTKIIASNVFNNCSRLTSITIPDSVTAIGNYTFYQCSNLASIIISKSVSVIGNGAFYNCSNLASVVILNKATKIGYDAFLECYKLDDIYYVGNQQEWDAIYGGCKDPLSATIHYNYVPTP